MGGTRFIDISVREKGKGSTKKIWKKKYIYIYVRNPPDHMKFFLQLQCVCVCVCVRSESQLGEKNNPFQKYIYIYKKP